MMEVVFSELKEFKGQTAVPSPRVTGLTHFLQGPLVLHMNVKIATEGYLFLTKIH